MRLKVITETEGWISVLDTDHSQCSSVCPHGYMEIVGQRCSLSGAPEPVYSNKRTEYCIESERRANAKKVSD